MVYRSPEVTIPVNWGPMYHLVHTDPLFSPIPIIYDTTIASNHFAHSNGFEWDAKIAPMIVELKLKWQLFHGISAHSRTCFSRRQLLPCNTLPDLNKHYNTAI